MTSVEIAAAVTTDQGDEPGFLRVTNRWLMMPSCENQKIAQR